MKMKEILDMPLRDVLEKYCILMSLECDWVYGIAPHDVIGEIGEKYDLCDEPSISPEPLINFEILAELEDPECEKDILTFSKIEEIIETLGLEDHLKEQKQ